MVPFLLSTLFVAGHLALTTPKDGPDANPRVVLAHTFRFAVHPKAAHANYLLACHHLRTYAAVIATNNTPEVFACWNVEMEWRKVCWDALWTALDGNQWGWWTRITWLNILRRELGEEAFWAGQMPAPIPSYR